MIPRMNPGRPARSWVRAAALMSLAITLVKSESLSMQQDRVPEFAGTTDVGAVRHPGSFSSDPTSGQIRITGSGENIWGRADAFTFAWERVSGDVVCRTDIAWIGTGRNPHRKAGWMLRAGLEEDDPYVDAVLHGDGLISMQYRAVKGGETAEVKSAITGPATLTFERTGNQFTLTVEDTQGLLHPAGTISVPLPGTLYAGLVVCSHDSTVSETALFSNARIHEQGVIPDSARVIESTLETFDIKTGIRTIVRRAREHFEAPNWSRDGRTLIYNSAGLLYSIPVAGGEPHTINTGKAIHCNNDHGLSWDGSRLVVSHQGDDGKSRIYLLKAAGGEPALITENGPSYWHGWSPDDKTLAYCAERMDEYDVYTIPVTGGSERRLTTAPGLDDGPEYSPDGKTIYFNSVRTGQMKIWKMSPEGSGQTQVSPDDNFGDWFPHPSPDGTTIVFLSYDKSVEGHPPNKDVVLRSMPAGGGEVKTLTRLFGGQGTLNVHSWSPDSRSFAFVSYRLVRQ
jgi:TolB protein